MKLINSRQNPFIKKIYKLSHTPDSYYKFQQILLEGDHLCRAYQEKIGSPQAAIFCESSYNNPHLADLKPNNTDIYVLNDELFQNISNLQSATGIAYLINNEANKPIHPHIPTIILDRLQDPGNIGTILRSASAFGFKQIIAMKNTCALWAPKTLRAGMGAHFSLKIHEHCDTSHIEKLQIPILGTNLNASLSLQETDIPAPCAWVIGHEGQGASQNLLQMCSKIIKINQPGGEESLNAAVACSICLYASSQQKMNT